jgi:hypothetical protein
VNAVSALKKVLLHPMPCPLKSPRTKLR